MNKSCSIRDVAKHAEVSPGTVSRVLNNRMGTMQVSDATKQKIFEVAKLLNYTPNINAKRLFSKRSGVVGLVVPSFHRCQTHVFDDIHLTRIISGMESLITGKDYSIQLLFNDVNFVARKRYLTMLQEHNIDGMIIWGAYQDEKYWNELIQSGYPYLFVSNLPDTGLAANYVSNDYEQAGYLAARHLLELGHRKIAWINGKPDILLNRLQIKGITTALVEYGLDFSQLVFLQGDYKTLTGEALIEQMLEQNCDVTAILSANNQMGAGAVNVLKARGIAVPGQIAVAACNGVLELDDVKDVSCSIVNDYMVGEVAAEGIIQLIENPTQNIRRLVNVTFEKRATT